MHAIKLIKQNITFVYVGTLCPTKKYQLSYNITLCPTEHYQLNYNITLTRDNTISSTSGIKEQVNT
jgi:triacylglycerol esterase/lipase EstA (alpha/beta hydrolase family)